MILMITYYDSTDDIKKNMASHFELFRYMNDI